MHDVGNWRLIGFGATCLLLAADEAKQKGAR